MKDGALIGWSNKTSCLFILDSERNKIKEISQYCRDIEPKIIFDGVDELTFTIHYNDIIKDAYNKIEENALINYEGFGEFIVVDVNETQIGEEYKFKEVSCYSGEHIFNRRLLSTYDKNTQSKYYQCFLWSDNESENSIMRDILLTCPSWSIGDVDSTLLNKQLSFATVRQENALSYMRDKVGNNFDCLFFFNSEERTIDIKSSSTAIQDTGVILTLDQYIKEFGKGTITEDIATCIDVKGGNLDITRVNPLGNRKIYFFNRYYSRMTNELRDKVIAWNNKIADNQTDYKDHFALYSEAETQRVYWENLWESLSPTNMKYNDKLNMLTYGTPEHTALLNEYLNWAYESGFHDASTNIDIYTQQAQEQYEYLQAINTNCQLENNFTAYEIKQLDNFIFESKYEKNAYSYVEGMTEKEKGDVAMALYESALADIERFNALEFEFTTTLVNFNNITNAQWTAEQLNVGKYITIKDGDGKLYKVIVVKIEPSSNNMDEINITFSSRLNYHENFSRLNDILNNWYEEAMKGVEDNNNTEQKVDKLITGLDNVNTRITDLTNAIPECVVTDVPIALPISTDYPSGKLGGIIPDNKTITVNPDTGVASATGGSGTGWKKEYNHVPTADELQADGIVEGDLIICPYVAG